MSAVYVRVDDRLVHGQITTNWIGNLDIAQIVVVDNKTAGNAMLKSIMSMAVPKNIDMRIIALEDLNPEAINNAGNTLIIVKYPTSIPEVLDRISEVAKVIIGTVVKQEGSRQITKNVYLTPEFESALNSAKEKVPVVLQQLPDSQKTDW